MTIMTFAPTFVEATAQLFQIINLIYDEWSKIFRDLIREILTRIYLVSICKKSEQWISVVICIKAFPYDRAHNLEKKWITYLEYCP